MKIFLSLILLLVLTFSLNASEFLTGNYYNGYQEDGYTYKDGLFYKNDTPYTREYYEYTKQIPLYNNYGQTYYQSKTYYNWRYIRAYPNTTPTVYNKDWKSELLNIAAQRDKVEGNLRTAALDHTAYLQAVKALGLEGNFRYQGYGLNPLTVQNQQQSYVPIVNQGNTVYGYSYSSVKDLYGDTNLGVLMQQVAQSTQRAQTLAGQAHTDMVDLVGKDINGRSRLAEIIVKGQAAAQALQAANPQPSQHIESRTFSFRLDQSADGGTQITPVQPTNPPEGPLAPSNVPIMPRASTNLGLDALMQSDCASCHTGAKAQGGFTVDSYKTMSVAERARRVWPLLTHTDSSKRMPKNKPPLTEEKLKLFYGN